MAAPYINKSIYEWNIRRLTERESHCPEVSASVRSLWSGLDGIQSIDVANSSDPVYIEWSDSSVRKTANGCCDDDSGYLGDEGYFDVRQDPPEIVTKREKVSRITYLAGNILFFTEEGHTFSLTTKKLYKLF